MLSKTFGSAFPLPPSLIFFSIYFYFRLHFSIFQLFKFAFLFSCFSSFLLISLLLFALLLPVSFTDYILTLSLPRVINFKFLFHSLTRDISYSMENYLAIDSLLSWKLIEQSFLTASLNNFFLNGWENLHYELGIERVNDCFILLNK